MVLCIQGSLISVSVDSTKHGLYNTVVFTIEKKSEHKWTHMVQTPCHSRADCTPILQCCSPIPGQQCHGNNKTSLQGYVQRCLWFQCWQQQRAGQDQVNIHQESDGGINYNNYTIEYYATTKRVTRILSVEWRDFDTAFSEKAGCKKM